MAFRYFTHPGAKSAAPPMTVQPVRYGGITYQWRPSGDSWKLMRAGGAVAEVVRDQHYRTMHRLELPGEPISDMVNLTRARDAALRRIGSKRPSATAGEHSFKEVVTMSTKTSTTDGDLDSLVRKHPQLYHYTTEAGLKGIVESNSVWATYFGDMNDANEIHELRVPLVTELARRLTPFVRELRQKGDRGSKVASKSAEDLARVWANSLYSTVFQKDEAGRTSACYISSFCSHSNDQEYERENGLLSQWRGYGKDGGFCLVFDTAALLTLFEQERRSYLFPFTDLREAHYPVEGAPKVAPFSELLQRSEEVIKSAVDGNRDFSVDEVLLAFVASATTFKHRGFFEEREVRLVAVAGTEAAAEMMKNVNGYEPMPLKPRSTIDRDGRKREYISLFGSDFTPLPIRRVIVGPSRSQDQNADTARTIVGDKISVSKSATPFIG